MIGPGEAPRRVLFIASRTSLVDGVPPHGSGVHVASSLAMLQREFDVLSLLGPELTAVSLGERRGAQVGRYIPKSLRGLRRDVALFREDRGFTRRGLVAARDFAPALVYERNEYLGVAGMRIANALGIPVVLEVNGLIANDTREWYRSVAEPYGFVVERWKYRNAAALVTTSPTLALALVKLGAKAERVAVIPNAIAPERVLSKPRAVREGAQLVVGWIGHGLSWHGLQLLAGAAEQVLRQQPETRFEVVGGGPGVEGLRTDVTDRGIAGQFTFRGEVRHEDVPEALARFDVGVVPANPDDRFPIKLVEMGGAGIPTVAPPADCIVDLLVSEIEFEPFMTGSELDLARAIVELLRSPERRAERGAALLSAVRDRFTWDVTSPQLAQFLHGLIEA